MLLMHKEINILFIGEPHSIHDIKWMTYFSGNDKYKIFLLSEYHHQDDYVEDKKRLAALNINFLGNISSFSIRKAGKTFEAIKTIRTHIKDKQIDFVHFLFATPYTLWALFISIPYVITTRGSDVLIVLPYLLRKKGLAAFRNTLLFNLFRRSFCNATLVTSTSVRQIAKIKELFGPKVISHLVRTGVPVAAISD
jgi:hypothetical protein